MFFEATGAERPCAINAGTCNLVNIPASKQQPNAYKKW
jgi:hypothetical protein